MDGLTQQGRDTLVEAHIRLHRLAAVDTILQAVLNARISLTQAGELYNMIPMPKSTQHYRDIADFYSNLEKVEKALGEGEAQHE